MKRVIATLLILVSLVSGAEKYATQEEVNFSLRIADKMLTADVRDIKEVFKLQDKLHRAYEGQFRKMRNHDKNIQSYINHLNKKIKKLQMKMVILETAEKFMREKLEKRIEVLEGKK